VSDLGDGLIIRDFETQRNEAVADLISGKFTEIFACFVIEDSLHVDF